MTVTFYGSKKGNKAQLRMQTHTFTGVSIAWAYPTNEMYLKERSDEELGRRIAKLTGNVWTVYGADQDVSWRSFEIKPE